MAWDATTQESTSNVGDTPPGREPGLALVILWSRDEPHRAGEVLLLPPGDRKVHIFGRGDEPPDDPTHHRLRLVRQRPGHNAITPPLASPKISRAHLRIQRLDARSVAIENLGKRAMRVRNKEVQQAVLSLGPRPLDALPRPQSTSPSQTVSIQGELLALLVERPAALPEQLHTDQTSPGFGAPCGLGLIGESPCIWELRDQLALAGRDAAPTLLHGPPGAGLAQLAEAAQRAATSSASRAATSLDLSATPPEDHRLALFGPSGVFADGHDVILQGLDGLAPQVVADLVRVLVERRLPTHPPTPPRPFEGRVIATTSRLDSLPSSLRGAFHHLVRARPLDERRDDLPFLALTEIRDIVATETLFRTRYPSPPPPSLALLELLSQLPLEGGLPTLRGILVRSMALTTGPELIAPPDLPLPAEPTAQPGPQSATPNPNAEPALPAPPPKDIPPSVLTGLPQLTKSERIVLQHLARNKTSREIAKTLFVSVRTVQNHRARICDKLGLRGNNALLGVALELREHLGPPP